MDPHIAALSAQAVADSDVDLTITWNPIGENGAAPRDAAMRWLMNRDTVTPTSPSASQHKGGVAVDGEVPSPWHLDDDDDWRLVGL